MKLARLLPLVVATGFVFCLCASCNYNTTPNQVVNDADSFNFVLKQYAAAQLRTYIGTPHSLFRISHLNDHTDTTIVDYLTMDWTGILQTFLAADISSKKFAGQYNWEISHDEMLGNQQHTFTAKDPKLFTRLMHVTVDPLENRITYIYIETRKSDFWGSKTGKLLYIPQRLIQIQETSRSLFGKARNLRIDYKAMGEEEKDEIVSR